MLKLTVVDYGINSVEVHSQPSNDGHPMDGVLVGAGRLSALCNLRTFPSISDEYFLLGKKEREYWNREICSLLGICEVSPPKKENKKGLASHSLNSMLGPCNKAYE